MAIVNSSDISRGFANIASLFAPPSAGDAASYAEAGLKNQKREELAKLFDMAQSAEGFNQTIFDRSNIAAGNYNPTQSFYAQDQNNATTQRGQDITSQTSIFNNAADNRTDLVKGLFGPLGEGERRPALPADISKMYELPAIGDEFGVSKPLSLDQIKAMNLMNLDLTPEQQLALGMGDAPVENIVGADGKPVVSYRADAVGKEPYFNKGAEAKPENAVAVFDDGHRVAIIQQTDGSWANAQTGEKLPPSGFQIMKLPQAQGSLTDVGLEKGTDSYIEKQLVDLASAKATATQLQQLIASSPASQGAVGWIRGTAQNLLATGNELGTFFGGTAKEVASKISEGLADADLAGSFDPNIPAIDGLANALAFQYGKTLSGDRFSNEMLNASRRALGIDKLDANQPDSLARIGQAIKQIEMQEATLHGILDKGVTSGVGAPAAPPDVTSMTDLTKVPDAWIKMGGTADMWPLLADDEKQQFLAGVAADGH